MTVYIFQTFYDSIVSSVEKTSSTVSRHNVNDNCTNRYRLNAPNCNPILSQDFYFRSIKKNGKRWHHKSGAKHLQYLWQKNIFQYTTSVPFVALFVCLLTDSYQFVILNTSIDQSINTASVIHSIFFTKERT
jgi:hypothetical protein